MVDDGSDDGTQAVADGYGDRIRFMRQERQGAGAARNAAVALAAGRYYAFLDADDRFTETKLEHQLAVLNDCPELDMVFGHVREFVSPELSQAQRAAVRAPAPPSPWTSPSLMLIRRASFERTGPFAVDLRLAEVVDWYARATEAGLKWFMLPEVVLERRLHTSNSAVRERDARLDYLRVVRASMERRRQA